MSSLPDESKGITPLKSNLEIVKACDNFPYYEPHNSAEEQEKYTTTTATLWKFLLPESTTPYGYIPSHIVSQMPWTSDFKLNSNRREIQLLPLIPTPNLSDACTHAIDTLLNIARAQGTFRRLGPPRNESLPILGTPLDIRIERSCASLFGIVGLGAHLNIFSRDSAGEMQIWIARRNAHKVTYAGLLDNAVAGGVAAGERPLECILREASEEAALEEDFVRERIRAVGCVSWFHICDEQAGGEVGLMNPGVLFVYDLEIEAGMQLVPVDGDIEGFCRMGVGEVRLAMARAEFKPACANVMMDFLIRHGFVTEENERDYVEIVERLHRKLEFPVTSMVV